MPTSKMAQLKTDAQSHLLQHCSNKHHKNCVVYIFRSQEGAKLFPRAAGHPDLKGAPEVLDSLGEFLDQSELSREFNESVRGFRPPPAVANPAVLGSGSTALNLKTMKNVAVKSLADTLLPQECHELERDIQDTAAQDPELNVLHRPGHEGAGPPCAALCPRLRAAGCGRCC